MSYKNSVKLLTTNFSVVWKQLLFLLVAALILFPISYGTSLPVINLLKEEGVIGEFATIFETIYTKPLDIITAISTAVIDLVDVLRVGFNQIWLSLTATILIIAFVCNMVKEISFYNVSSVMHLHLTSYVDIGYTRNLISTLGQSVRFAFVKTLFKIPFFILRAVTLVTYFRLVNSWIGIFIGLFIVSLLLVMLYALEITLFSGFAGKMLDYNGNISSFKALFTGIATTLKVFVKTFLNSIIVVLTIIFINGFLGLFTIGVAFLITIPASMVFVSIFELVTYLSAKGDRYYLTDTIIVNPITTNNNPKKIV